MSWLSVGQRIVEASIRLAESSVPSALNYWVKTLELDACFGVGELPVDANDTPIALSLPGGDFASEDF